MSMFITWEAFLKEKDISFDSIKDDAEKVADVYNKFNAKRHEQYEEALSDKVDKSVLNQFQKEAQEFKEKAFNALNDALARQGIMLKKLTPKQMEERKKSHQEQLREGLEANLEKLKTLKNGSMSEAKAAGFKFETKAPATMTNAGNVSGGNVPVEDRLEGFNTIPSRRIRLLDVMSQRTTSSNVVSWVYQANKDGAAGQTAEGTAKNQIDFDIVVDNDTVKKTTAFIKVSTEMLDDIEWIQSEINAELMRELLKKVESTTYSGNGAGQEHTGIVTVASAFAAGTFAGTVDNANIVDVLVVASNQIKVAQELEAMPSAIFMHPTDVTSLKLEKVSSTDKRYVDRLTQIGSMLMLDGTTPIIETTLVPVGDYLIGDFSKSISVTRTGMTFDIGLDGNDFTNNVRTILAEWRGLTIVKQNDRSAFVTGTFATDIAALETP